MALAAAGCVKDARAANPAGATTVAVLGDSRTDGCVGHTQSSDCRRQDDGFNQPVLSSLLHLLAVKNPAAVFFTGDLTLGLEKEEEDGKIDPGAHPATGGWARNFEYHAGTFQRMLAAFKTTVKQQIGKIPFHPVVGNHDTAGPDAVALFRRAFSLQHPPGGYREPAHLAYTIQVGGAAFVVLATDYYQSCAERGVATPACNVQEHIISQPQISWLDGQLAKHVGQRLFVLGHEPAFSAGGSKSGLDNNQGARDVFWAILKRRGVTAYLCSHQHELEISQHDGVWQIISGGAGAPLDGGKKGGSGAPAAECTGGVALQPGFAERSFFHYILLNIPGPGPLPGPLPGPGQAPGATLPGPVTGQVRDCNDTLRRTFELTPLAPR